MTPERIVSARIRLSSMLLDHIFMTLICMLFFVPLISAFDPFTVSHEINDTSGAFSGPLLYVALFGFALYFCKDCINGRSIAKRIIQLQVIDNQTGQVASPLQCLIRNVFCIIWPIEVIVTLLNPERRIGDYIARTKVACYDPQLVEQPTAEIKQLVLPVLLSFGLLLLATSGIKSLPLLMQKVKYVENSYNETESKALEKLYDDSLGQKLHASVKVYDKIERQQLKYISVIYTLKENYLDDSERSKELKMVTTRLLYSMFPENTFTGWAQYVFQEPGTMQSSSNPIGANILPTGN